MKIATSICVAVVLASGSTIFAAAISDVSVHQRLYALSIVDDIQGDLIDRTNDKLEDFVGGRHGSFAYKEPSSASAMLYHYTTIIFDDANLSGHYSFGTDINVRSDGDILARADVSNYLRVLFTLSGSAKLTITGSVTTSGSDDEYPVLSLYRDEQLIGSFAVGSTIQIGPGRYKMVFDGTGGLSEVWGTPPFSRSFVGDVEYSVTPIPEPSAALLFLTGIGVAAIVRHRVSRRSSR
jgi:PEP-CTERM putative exosortase interaction domain